MVDTTEPGIKYLPIKFKAGSNMPFIPLYLILIIITKRKQTSSLTCPLAASHLLNPALRRIAKSPISCGISCRRIANVVHAPTYTIKKYKKYIERI